MMSGTLVVSRVAATSGSSSSWISGWSSAAVPSVISTCGIRTSMRAACMPAMLQGPPCHPCSVQRCTLQLAAVAAQQNSALGAGGSAGEPKG